VDDPHLVTGPAGGNIKTLFEQFLIAEGERPSLRGIDKGDKNDIALVALELGGISAKQAMVLVAVRRKM